MKLIAQIIAFGFLLASLVMAAYFGVLNFIDQEAYSFIFNNVFGLFLGAVALFLIIRYGIPLKARFDMWKIAAKRDLEQEREIKEQKDFVEYLKARERQSNGDLIKISKVKEKDWIGVEIYNGEKGNPFRGRLLVIDVTGHAVRNRIEVINSDTQHTDFEAPSGQRATMRLISWFGSNPVPSITSRVSNQIQFSESREYKISTIMLGNFWSDSLTTVEIRNDWKFIFDNDNNTFEFEKISEERVNQPPPTDE